MSCYDEEFYNEPSEFDQQVDEFKQALMKSVKADFIAKMDRLEKENVELQKIKGNWESIQSEYADKHRQLEYKKENMEREVRRTRIGELMKDLEVKLYDVGYEYLKHPKCNKCNENRQFEFTSPTGKILKENCDCAGNYSIYVPEETIMSEMRSRDGKVTAWYKKYRDSDEGMTLSSSTVVTKIYDPVMEFQSLEQYGTFFRNIEDCQRYCDWLNEHKK